MLEWLAKTWVDFQQFLYSILLTLLDALKDLFYFIFEIFMDLVVVILEGMGALFEGLDISGYINGIPPNVAYYMGAVGLGEATGMIITSLTIRFMLQLVPFTRLGS
ncbi:VSK receptor [Pseudoalteromonas rubra]|uniref:VSK receptor n=1 Tax=Pseudoalteromonas rubra TaxID=43658 RepID=A0A5S3WRY4_9GAMM|nr:DUF2523 family protein [Pseudoalteromonas rubra]TMP30183.1 VSK receptor [Pseudoalteromonas rubra]TMP31948.1 VSK receptor [Pseudoalteromonas rubra]